VKGVGWIDEKVGWLLFIPIKKSGFTVNRPPKRSSLLQKKKKNEGWLQKGSVTDPRKKACWLAGCGFGADDWGEREFLKMAEWGDGSKKERQRKG
jgi:hypothetical protein